MLFKMAGGTSCGEARVQQLTTSEARQLEYVRRIAFSGLILHMAHISHPPPKLNREKTPKT